METLIASIMWVGFAWAPLGTLEANGQCLPVNHENAPLYSLIGNTYGGDSTKFCLPDLRPKRADGKPDDKWNNGPRAVIVIEGIYPQRP